MYASCVRGRRSIAKTTRMPRTMANPIAIEAITFPRSVLPSLIGISRQPYQPHREGACASNRQHDDEGDGYFLEQPGGLEDGAGCECQRNTHQRAYHPRRKIRA